MDVLYPFYLKLLKRNMRTRRKYCCGKLRTNSTISVEGLEVTSHAVLP